MRYLAIIPARGASKGVHKKNIRLLNGKPLIFYTLEVARQFFNDADICVSTDDEEIKKIVETTGLKIPFNRPAHLATDNATTHQVLLHAISYYEHCGQVYDAVVLLQPTSPLRTAQHIKEAVGLFDLELDMVVSVKETQSNPYFVLFEEDDRGFLMKSKKGDFTRRQDCPKVWEYNGAIYVMNIRSLKKYAPRNMSKIKKYVMNERESIDLDSSIDFMLAEHLLKS